MYCTLVTVLIKSCCIFMPIVTFKNLISILFLHSFFLEYYNKSKFFLNKKYGLVGEIKIFN